MDPEYWFFKLFNSIKEEHEVDFAKLELLSLLGPVEPVRNFADVIDTTPLKHFTSDPIRIQDVLAYEPCYGRVQGFMAVLNEPPNLERLTRRLAYTREIVTVFKGSPPTGLKHQIDDVNQTGRAAVHNSGGHFLARIVTNQYYLEKSAYVSKLSRNEEEVRANVRTLLEYPFQQFYRIPASATMSVGKRLEDYFTIREESSLYLMHMLHPYKGKFHPKMVQALLNYAMPKDQGHAMDNFAGSGTLLLDATLMGIDNVGVEINPLSVLMSQVKSECLTLDPAMLKDRITLFLREVSTALTEYQTVNSGDTLVQPKFDERNVAERVEKVPPSVKDIFGPPRSTQEFIIAQQVLTGLTASEEMRRFLLLGLSGTISDLARRTSQGFIDVLSQRLSWMYLRIFLFAELNRHLGIKPGRSMSYVGDTRDMRACWGHDGRRVPIRDNSIDGIVNSPPYSTALDYIRNDLPQLTILDLAKSLDQLERDMVGNPNLRYYPEQLSEEVAQNAPEFERLPDEAKKAIRRLIDSGRRREALRVYKFFKDMFNALGEMSRVLKPGGRAVIIIGNNHYKLNGDYVEVKNDEVIARMAEDIGMMRDKQLPLPREKWDGEEALPQIPGGVRRRLEKTLTGMIRYETVLVLEKTS